MKKTKGMEPQEILLSRVLHSPVLSDTEEACETLHQNGIQAIVLEGTDRFGPGDDDVRPLYNLYVNQIDHDKAARLL